MGFQYFHQPSFPYELSAGRSVFFLVAIIPKPFFFPSLSWSWFFPELIEYLSKGGKRSSNPLTVGKSVVYHYYSSAARFQNPVNFLDPGNEVSRMVKTANRNHEIKIRVTPWTLENTSLANGALCIQNLQSVFDKIDRTSSNVESMERSAACDYFLRYGPKAQAYFQNLFSLESIKRNKSLQIGVEIKIPFVKFSRGIEAEVGKSRRSTRFVPKLLVIRINFRGIF